jgi:RNA polymerase sigma factor (sigma-70 family)
VTKGQQSFGRDIQALFDTGAMGELTDRPLLERFNARDEEGAELAFAVLVERHGPMVFHACRSILRDRHAAEDAFQATFLILSRKARSLWVRDSLGPWLFATACRVAWCARAAASRRRKHEQKAAQLVTPTIVEGGWDDRDAVLYDELNRLPERYRVAVMLCDLDGLTQEQAARQLGWPPGTVRSRLARGRGRLRDQLTRRGLAPAIVPLGASLARPAVPASLAALTVETAVSLAPGGVLTGTLTSAIALTEGVMTMLYVSKLKLVLALVLTGGAMIGGTALIGHRAMRLAQAAPRDAKTQSEAPAGPQGELNVPGQPAPEALSSIAKARLDLAKRLRDTAYNLYEGGESDLATYLNAQRRYDDVVGAVTVKSNADRVRFNEVRVAGWKRVTEVVRELRGKGQKTESDVLAVELERLEAEDALAKAKAKIGAEGATLKARLEVAKKVRDTMYQLFKEGGNIDLERYLTWQKRYDDLAYVVTLMTDGDRVRLYEGQVAELNQLEQLQKDRFRRGEVGQIELHIVQYYRLEAEEALARAKAEAGESLGKASAQD